MTYEIFVPLIALVIAGGLYWLSHRDTQRLDKRLSEKRHPAE